MTHPTTPHEPTPEFRMALEQEVVRAARRSSQLTTRGPGGLWKRILSSSRLIAAAAIGIFVGAAPAQLRDARLQESLITIAQADENLANARLAAAQRALEVTRERYNLALTAASAVAVAEAEVRSMELKLAAIRLNIEEIRATSAQPQDALSAPRIGQRDFVTERLQLQLGGAQQALVAAEAASEISQRRERLGLESSVALLEAQLELARARSRMELVADKIALRARHLAEGIAAAEVERLVQILELRQDLAITQRQHAIAEERLNYMKARLAAGTVMRSELLTAELELLERATELQRITAELRLLEAGRRGG